jgi:hypothetical protein
MAEPNVINTRSSMKASKTTEVNYCLGHLPKLFYILLYSQSYSPVLYALSCLYLFHIGCSLREKSGKKIIIIMFVMHDQFKTIIINF